MGGNEKIILEDGMISHLLYMYPDIYPDKMAGFFR